MELRQVSQIIGYVPRSHVPAYDYAVRDFVAMGRTLYLGTFQQPGPKDFELVNRVMEEMNILHLADCP